MSKKKEDQEYVKETEQKIKKLKIKIFNRLTEAGLEEDDIEDLILELNDSHIKYYQHKTDKKIKNKRYLEEDKEINEYKPVYRKIYEIDDPDKLFEVMGMFTNLPKGVNIDDIVNYFSGIPVNKHDKGKKVGNHIINDRDIKYKFLKCYIKTEDVDKTIGDYVIKARDVGLTVDNLIPNQNDVGKTLGGIKIKITDVGTFFEGVRITEEDIGILLNTKVIEDSDIDQTTRLELINKDIGKFLGGIEITVDNLDDEFTILEEDLGKVFGGYEINRVLVGNSIGGINFYQLGFDSPIYISSRYNNEIILESIRDETEGEVGAIKCNKCGSNETSSFQAQTRSSDEPMTVFWTCTKCGKKGRQG